MSLFLHEIGHILAILYYNLKIEYLSFMGFGAKISTNYEECEDKQKIVINLAGPLVNMIMAVICSIFPRWLYIVYFLKVNIYICLFNILPINPLDGSKILEVILDKTLGYNKSRRIIRKISKVSAIIFIIWGIIQIMRKVWNINIIFIGIYIMQKEYKMAMLNGIERILNRRERFLKKGVYPIRHIAVLSDGMVNDVIKSLDFDSIHLINVLNKDLTLIDVVTEEQLVNELLEKGTNITFNDILCKQNKV